MAARGKGGAVYRLQAGLVAGLLLVCGPLVAAAALLG
jgi:hypothetical protein